MGKFSEKNGVTSPVTLTASNKTLVSSDQQSRVDAAFGQQYLIESHLLTVLLSRLPFVKQKKSDNAFPFSVKMFFGLYLRLEKEVRIKELSFDQMKADIEKKLAGEKFIKERTQAIAYLSKDKDELVASVVALGRVDFLRFVEKFQRGIASSRIEVYGRVRYNKTIKSAKERREIMDRENARLREIAFQKVLDEALGEFDTAESAFAPSQSILTKEDCVNQALEALKAYPPQSSVAFFTTPRVEPRSGLLYQAVSWFARVGRGG